MPSSISEKTIQQIISNFLLEINDYEIINIEDLKGWSSDYLYLLVSTYGNYILKGKSKKQINGYENEVIVSKLLDQNNIPTRLPILTTKNEIFYKAKGFYWCLMSYIPGTASHIDEYTNDTAASLGKVIDKYVSLSQKNEQLMNLEIKPISKKPLYMVLEDFHSKKDYFKENKFIDTSDIETYYIALTEGFKKHIEPLNNNTLIHNDINPRNILIDHTSKEVITLIDWDHVKYGNPLKDVSDAVAIFYDFFSSKKAKELKMNFQLSIKGDWFTALSKDTIDFAFVYYYTIAKWRAVVFYTELLIKYDDKYGERTRFINEIKQNYNKWLNVIGDAI